jgi:hypothetical protein
MGPHRQRYSHPSRFLRVPVNSSRGLNNLAQRVLTRVVFSPRSGRRHKAWGVSPRIEVAKCVQPAERATAFNEPLVRPDIEDQSSLRELYNPEICRLLRGRESLGTRSPELTPRALCRRAFRALFLVLPSVGVSQQILLPLGEG